MTDDERKQLIRSLCCPDANEVEFQFFIEQCVRLGLDPLARQAYLFRRGGKMSLEVSIDGYRSVADRTGELAGVDEPVFSGEGIIQTYDKQGKLVDGKHHPECCSVTVYRLVGGQARPFVGTAYWQDFFQANNAMWQKMPYRMLSVRAQSAALKTAFPILLSGTYTPDEMSDSMLPDAPQKALAAPEDARTTKELLQTVKSHIVNLGGPDHGPAQAEIMVEALAFRPQVWTKEIYLQLLSISEVTWNNCIDRVMLRRAKKADETTRAVAGDVEEVV